MRRNDRICLATVAEGFGPVARQYGLGVECDVFCTAVNLEDPAAIRQAADQVQHIGHRILHAPFNELCPAAIDPEVLRITRMRYEQAWAMAQKMGARSMVVHSGFIPAIYYPQWFVEKSVHFWRAFLADKPKNCRFLLENVLESEPGMLLDIVRQVDDPRFRLCLDTGHAHCQAPHTPVEHWVRAWAPLLGHAHIHNNDGTWDTHSDLDDGTIPMEGVLELMARLVPEATWTVETLNAPKACRWLADRGWIEETAWKPY